MATLTGKHTIQCADATSYADWVSWLNTNNFTIGNNGVIDRVDDSVNNKITLTYSSYEYEP